jgi:hypothetical protein
MSLHFKLWVELFLVVCNSQYFNMLACFSALRVAVRTQQEEVILPPHFVLSGLEIFQLDVQVTELERTGYEKFEKDCICIVTLHCVAPIRWTIYVMCRTTRDDSLRWVQLTLLSFRRNIMFPSSGWKIEAALHVRRPFFSEIVLLNSKLT